MIDGGDLYTYALGWEDMTTRFLGQDLTSSRATGSYSAGDLCGKTIHEAVVDCNGKVEVSPS